MTATTRASPRLAGRTTMLSMWATAEANLIRGLRQDRGLTQEGLAFMVGLENRQAICNIETARNHVPEFRLALFADALHVPLRGFGLALMRVQHPWFFAATQGTDAKLEAELRYAMVSTARPRVRRTAGG